MCKRKGIYVDASAVLGMFDVDEARQQQTAIFWDAVRSGEIIVVLSVVLDAETEKSRERVQAFLNSLPKSQVKRVMPTVESDALAQHYIDAKVISDTHMNDCIHVALATLEADGIVSWNLRDMIKRYKKYNSVNLSQKYRKIVIRTPDKYKEIYHDET